MRGRKDEGDVFVSIQAQPTGATFGVNWHDPSVVGTLVEVPECQTVLIVDDEFGNLLVLEALLEDEGYTVLTAENGHKALDCFREHPDIDMVISDQRMPHMSGVELLANIAKSYPDTIRVVLTAYSDVSPIVSAVNDGAVYRFLLKPWSDTELKATVADGLAMRTQHLLLQKLVTTLSVQHRRLVRTLSDLHKTHDQQIAAERLGTLGRLASGITHDVNNHLTLIQGVLSEIETQSPSAPILSALTDAKEHITSLVSLMRDVNSFARSEEIQVRPTPYASQQFLSETLSLFRLETGHRRCAWRIDVHPNAQEILADRARLSQGILALLRNAAASNPKTVTLSVYREADEIMFEVMDDGDGMSTETLANALTPFFSATRPRGLGIGLGIARLVAVAHGGSLELISALNQGTTARLKISAIANGGREP